MTKRDELLSAGQAAELMGVHVETVRRLARRREIPSFKVGADWRFSREALHEWFAGQQPRGGAPLVLVVDDEPEMVRSMSRMVERLGCRSQTAADGIEALERVNLKVPDLIFLDLAMPGMNGPEFLERLRGEHPSLLVVIVTGHPDSDLMHRAAQYPPVMLLPKPAEPGQVERTVRAVLGDAMAKGDHRG